MAFGRTPTRPAGGARAPLGSAGCGSIPAKPLRWGWLLPLPIGSWMYGEGRKAPPWWWLLIPSLISAGAAPPGCVLLSPRPPPDALSSVTAEIRALLRRTKSHYAQLSAETRLIGPNARPVGAKTNVQSAGFAEIRHGPCGRPGWPRARAPCVRVHSHVHRLHTHPQEPRPRSLAASRARAVRVRAHTQMQTRARSQPPQLHARVRAHTYARALPHLCLQQPLGGSRAPAPRRFAGTERLGSIRQPGAERAGSAQSCSARRWDAVGIGKAPRRSLRMRQKPGTAVGLT